MVREEERRQGGRREAERSRAVWARLEAQATLRRWLLCECVSGLRLRPRLLPLLLFRLRGWLRRLLRKTALGWESVRKVLQGAFRRCCCLRQQMDGRGLLPNRVRRWRPYRISRLSWKRWSWTRRLRRIARPLLMTSQWLTWRLRRMTTRGWQ